MAPRTCAKQEPPPGDGDLELLAGIAGAGPVGEASASSTSAAVGVKEAIEDGAFEDPALFESLFEEDIADSNAGRETAVPPDEDGGMGESESGLGAQFTARASTASADIARQEERGGRGT